MKSRLYTPGPTEVPDAVLAAMLAAVPHPRSTDFIDVLRTVSEQLRAYFRTAHEVMILTSSGTGAMEAAVVNFLRRGQKIVTVEGGKFGERWGEIARAHAVPVESLSVPWGESLAPHRLGAFLRRQGEVAAVYLTHSETSTGVAFDIQGLAEVVRNESDALVVVDGISSVGVLPFEMDDWGVDVCVSASQKGAMVPPGLAFIAVGERGWLRSQQADLPRYYFDCTKAREGLAAGGTPWTPAVTLVCGLRKALEIVLAQGLEVRWQRFSQLAQGLRAALPAMGLEIFPQSPGDAVTAVELPERIDARVFVRHLRDRYGVFVAGGQGRVKKRIFRVAHMGYSDYLDMVSLISAVALGLREFGCDPQPGEAIAAFQSAYLGDAGMRATGVGVNANPTDRANP